MNSFYQQQSTHKSSLPIAVEETSKPICLIVDEVDGAIGSGSNNDSTKGIGLIVEYLKKCINYSQQKQKQNGKKGDDDDYEDDLEKPDEGDQEKE